MTLSHSLDSVTAEYAAVLTGREFRPALIVALGTVPFTIFFSWRQQGSAIVGAPLVVAGVAVGILYSRRAVDIRRVGTLAGLVASLGVVVWQMLSLASISAGESGFPVPGLILLAPIVAVIGVLVSVLIVSGSTFVTTWLISLFE